jgi:hypothetical protein
MAEEQLANALNQGRVRDAARLLCLEQQRAAPEEKCCGVDEETSWLEAVAVVGRIKKSIWL